MIELVISLCFISSPSMDFCEFMSSLEKRVFPRSWIVDGPGEASEADASGTTNESPADTEWEKIEPPSSGETKGKHEDERRDGQAGAVKRDFAKVSEAHAVRESNTSPAATELEKLEWPRSGNPTSEAEE